MINKKSIINKYVFFFVRFEKFMKLYIYPVSEMVLSRKNKGKIIFAFYFRFCPSVLCWKNVLRKS